MNIFQQLEQLQATFRDLSPVLWSYHSRLMEQGFTREEAFQLTRDAQEKLFG